MKEDEILEKIRKLKDKVKLWEEESKDLYGIANSIIPQIQFSYMSSHFYKGIEDALTRLRLNLAKVRGE